MLLCARAEPVLSGIMITRLTAWEDHDRLQLFNIFNSSIKIKAQSCLSVPIKLPLHSRLHKSRLISILYDHSSCNHQTPAGRIASGLFFHRPNDLPIGNGEKPCLIRNWYRQRADRQQVLCIWEIIRIAGDEGRERERRRWRVASTAPLRAEHLWLFWESDNCTSLPLNRSDQDPELSSGVFVFLFKFCVTDDCVSDCVLPPDRKLTGPRPIVLFAWYIMPHRLLTLSMMITVIMIDFRFRWSFFQWHKVILKDHFNSTTAHTIWFSTIHSFFKHADKIREIIRLTTFPGQAVSVWVKMIRKNFFFLSRRKMYLGCVCCGDH